MDECTIPAEFFLEYPLFRKYKMELPPSAADVELPSFVSRCCVCGSDQTFVPQRQNKTYIRRSEDQPPSRLENGSLNIGMPTPGKEMVATFTCAGCRESDLAYYIKFGPDSDSVQKIGQSPPWSINLDKALQRRLGEYQDLFRKGLVCESQGYGIGAYAYYRRVIEDMIDELLVDILDLLDPSIAAEKKRELQDIRDSKRTVDKIEVVSKILPQLLSVKSIFPSTTITLTH